MKLPKIVRELLACPRCHGDLVAIEEDDALGCRTCRLRYPVKDGIAVMLKDAAVEWRDDVS